MRSTNKKQFSQRTAFSVVELVIVVLIIGILSAVIAPRYIDLLSKHSIESAAKRLKLDLELAVSTAKTTSSEHRVVFLLDDNSYEFKEIRDLDLASKEYSVDLNAEPYRSTIQFADFGDTTELNVNGYGIPNEPGVIQLQCGKYRHEVTIDANGVVKIKPGPFEFSNNTTAEAAFDDEIIS